MKTLTIAICSYQRRDLLIKLLLALDDQASRAGGAWDGVDVVAVIDGSTDGSREAANALHTGLPVEVVYQDNAGLSAARNRCLEHATGELIYFLDDDLIPAEGTVLKHRTAQRDGKVHVVLGPCLIPLDFDAPQNVRQWFTDRYQELSEAEFISQFDRFSIANASGYTDEFRSVGGFDASFVGYGLEDYEIGLRLMELGIFERFDESAIAWHYTNVDERATVPRSRETGRNAVRLLRTHPAAAAVMFPGHYSGPATWAVDRLHLRSPRPLVALALVAQWCARRAGRAPARVRETLWALAAAAGHSAGVADLDPSMVPDFLGRPSEPTTGRRWDRVSAVAKPAASTPVSQ